MRTLLATAVVGLGLFFLAHAAVLIQTTLHAISVDDFRATVVLYLFIFAYALSAAATLNLFWEYKVRRQLCPNGTVRELLARFHSIRWMIPSGIAFCVFILGGNSLTTCPFLKLVAMFTYIHMVYLAVTAVALLSLSFYVKPRSSQS